MLLALLLAQSASGADLIKDAWKQCDSANSITVTQLKTSEEFKRDHRAKFFWRKGGYFRAEDGPVVDVSNPKHGYTFNTDKKIYQERSPMPADFTIANATDVDVFNSGFPVIGVPTAMTWHGKKTLRIELDGRTLTKETKLFVFVDPKTHSPVGVSANLGSITQVTIYEDLKINPIIKDSLFQFTPPKGWKKVTPSTGGWK